MFFSRLSWLRWPLRRASTDSRASRALHVTSEDTSPAPPCLGALRLADAEGLPEVVGGAREGGARSGSWEVKGYCGCPGDWVARRGPGPLGVTTLGPPSPASLARLGFRSALCSRALSQHRAPPTSGLWLPGLKSWPQASRRLVWIGRQKRTAQTVLFVPSSF